ncbi:DNA topoisomerase I [Candidatus Bathyarchaeota archaeon]|nr:DNA topoisomerase I [Candidatus Bathyarchaeota archaeon]MBT4321290.1 DNA topoisomerase I [Candidatus Bathyarchaeota archaeon]MBT4424091.1 DNA topoisomerase I [Candidatus Bathyarchaeota archaeon]MBT6604134.1 DNA topoisomerase I [Candidatus Bathyarchaeota archaeon]MBT7188083.1 DNA topoisomerase I [Candidatus Bathyarchaeota archaeon]
MFKRALVITEKPSSARRLASALDENGKPNRGRHGKVSFYISYRDGMELVVVSAVGHLYTIVQKKGGWTYPIYDIKWVPSHKADKRSSYTKQYLKTIIDLSNDIDEYVSACDYDQEGSLIAFNIIKHGLGEAALGKSKRMLFNTLTKHELVKSWENRQTLDYPVIAAGKVRHEADWLYGINLSRALTITAKKRINTKKTLSVGRVQGPTLRFVYDLESRINSFVPIPYWKVSAETIIDEITYPLEYEKPRLEREVHAKTVAEECRGKDGVITAIEGKEAKIQPPAPFNLGDLQQEAYRVFNYNPSVTLKIAEKLYLSALISYPRTSSQRISPTIDVREILVKLGENIRYERDVTTLAAKKRVKPRQGKKDDPAHPAIHPTGNKPGLLKPEELNVYDLVVRRFLASLGKPLIRSKSTVDIGVNGHTFYIKGDHTIDPGWTLFYQPYFKSKDTPLPEVIVGMVLPITKLSTRRQYSKPPARFTASSLVRKMEDEGIGTKATRSNIIDTLRRRGYIRGQKVTITGLGSNVIEALAEYSPDIIDVNLTKTLETELDRIESGTGSAEEVIKTTISTLDAVLKRFKEKEVEIGASLTRRT